jgi:glycosyltransferase involved in cell wall biosynthesis
MRYAWDQRDAYFPARAGAIARARHGVLDALKRWDARVSERVHTFVANSSFVRVRIRRYYDRDAEVVAPPVDVEFFHPDPEDATRRRASPFALVVAALAPYKKVAEAVEACRHLGLELRIVGTGPERERIEAMAAGEAGGAPAVRVLGQVSDGELRELYRGAACFLQPGVEDFGIASVEALACGCPVVAAGRGGVLDVVEDGVHGLLYPGDGGIEELKSCIDKALRMHFNILNLRNRASRFSRARFRERMRSVLQTNLER